MIINQIKLFFSLSWEKLQSSRLPSKNGWELFKKHVNNIFSHAITLELLNHIIGFQEKITYKELKIALVISLEEPEKRQLLEKIEKVTTFYSEGEFGCGLG